MRQGYSQKKSLLNIKTVLNSDELLPYEFLGVESISENFKFHLKLRSSNTELNLEDILQTEVSVSLLSTTESPRYFHGIISLINQSGIDSEFAYYEIDIVPKLELLKYSRNRKIFQNLSAIDIVEGILHANKIDIDNRLSKIYKKRDYCVQYDESDFDFIYRLLASEGIFYYFKFAQDRHTMVFGDSLGSYSSCAEPFLYYRSIQDERINSNTVFQFESMRKLAPRSVVSQDYDYENAGILIKDTFDSEKDYGEVYVYPAGFSNGDIPQERSKTESINLRLNSVSNKGRSVCFRVESGRYFTLKEYTSSEKNTQYVLTHVSHTFKNEEYQNYFETIPISHPFSFENKFEGPRVYGTHSAFVVGPPGEEIWTDNYGRIKVKFQWDRSGATDENCSCWLRVSQSWADAGWGNLFIPRIGQEVLVSYIDGDPDRPVVTGSVYNSENNSPVRLPANQTQSVIKTKPFSKMTVDDTSGEFVTDLSQMLDPEKNKSTILSNVITSVSGDPNDGRGVGNEIRFEDKMNEEEFYQHAHKDMKVDVENDLTTTVYRGNENHSIHHGNRSVEVLAGDETHFVNGNRELEIHGDEIKKNKKNLTKKIQGNLSYKVNGDYDIEVDGNFTIKVKGKVIIEVDDSIDVLTGDSFSVESAQGVEIKTGTNIKAEAGVTTEINSGTSVTIKAGGVAAIKAPAVQLGA